MTTLPPQSETDRPGISIALVQGPVDGDPDRAGNHPGGGTCCFLGTTRPETHEAHGNLVALEYEAAGLATSRMKALAESIVAEHDLHGLSIEHAVGAVPIGRTSVRIIASADHREAAFGGCRAAIDRLKREIPIWKREVWEKASTWSRQATPLTEAES